MKNIKKHFHVILLALGLLINYAYLFSDLVVK